MTVIIETTAIVILSFVVLVLCFYGSFYRKKALTVIAANEKLVKRIIALEKKQDEIRQEAYDEGFYNGESCGANNNRP